MNTNLNLDYSQTIDKERREELSAELKVFLIGLRQLHYNRKFYKEPSRNASNILKNPLVSWHNLALNDYIITFVNVILWGIILIIDHNPS